MQKSKKKIIIFGMMLIAVILLTASLTYAKYIKNAIFDYYLKSKGFYFYSDNLDVETVMNLNESWNEERIFFNIRNNQSETTITDYDIEYEVACTIKGEAHSNVLCHLDGTTNNVAKGTLSASEGCFDEEGTPLNGYNKSSCELGNHTWRNQITERNMYFELVLANPDYEITDIVVNITVTSTDPYRKVLSGDFIIHKGETGENNINLSFKELNDYYRLVISNSYPENKCLKINWDANNLIIQENKNNFESYGENAEGYINEITLNVLPNNSKSYIFYPKNFNNSYNISEFEWEESNVCP